MYKIGDLVKLDAAFQPERHPPMGTYGIVVDVEDCPGEFHDSNSDSDEMVDMEQYVRVHWTFGPNSKEQCYMDGSLKMVKEC